MEIKISTKKILRVLYVLSCILFIGTIIEATGFIFSAFYTLVINPVNAAHFWENNDLSSLYHYDPGHFAVEALLISIPAVLKACMLYLVVNILRQEKLDLTRPFSNDVRRFIINLTWITFGIGLFTGWGAKYTKWLITLGIEMPDTQQLRLGGADVWLLMSITFLIIAQIFKRGIEIQSENELTV